MEVLEKSQTVDPEVSAYVRSLVSAIGGKSALDDGRYVLGDDALACLKDLRRWLKLYDTKLDRFDVKRILAEANLVQGDLLEILGTWEDDDESNTLRRKIALGSLELLTELTWPLVLVADRATINHVRHLPNIELAQVKYKRAILHHDSDTILRKAISAAVPCLSKARRERTPRDEGIINLVLYLFRNITIIAAPTNLSANIDQHDVSRAQVIHAFQDQDVLHLILTICSGMGEEFDEQDVVVMELLFHLLKGIDPKSLFRSEKEVNTDSTNDLKKALLAEKAMLASQARNAPTRHNRFGTMIWVKQPDEKVSTVTGQTVIASEQKTLEKMDMSKKWNRPHYRGRHIDVPGNGRDFAPVQLDARATKGLEEFVSEFLDSSFNPLFIHLRRTIEREAERVKEDHGRQFFYLIHWFLAAEEARRQKNSKAPAPSMTEDEARQQITSFAYVASVLNQETFVLLNRRMQNSLDEKIWHELHTCMLAFTRIMLTVSAMSESPADDDQDIAENIQSRIFYEESTHDRILQILRGYQEGRQGFAYLDACTDLAHVFIRLLERYSKVNVDMFIRSKRRARRKLKAVPKGTATVEGLEDSQPQEEDGAGDEVEAHREVQERKFDFSRFASRFINDGSVDTFVTLLSHYRDLKDEQLKRCHRFFYRVAFKMERVMLLFRVDILRLFHTMIQGREGLDMKLKRKSPPFQEWEELAKQIFRRCIKKLEERPIMYVELLFTKMPATLFYLEHGYEKEVVKSVPRAPAELEIKPGMDHEQQIGVAVGVLVDQGKLDMLTWVKTILMKGIEERRSWEDRNGALKLLEQLDKTNKSNNTDFGDPLVNGGLDKGGEADQQDRTVAEKVADDKLLPPPIVVEPDSNERRIATFKDKHLRLLFKTLSFHRLGASDDPDVNWIIPSELTAKKLEDDLDAIKKAEFDPPSYEDGKSAEYYTRNVLTVRANAYEKEVSDDEGASDVDEGLFVPGGPTRRPDDQHKDRPKKKRRLQRKCKEMTDEQQMQRADARKQREREKDAKIKSALFVTESDDEEDEERHAEFFKLEQARREGTIKKIQAALIQDQGNKDNVKDKARDKAKDKAKAKASKKGTKRTVGATDDEATTVKPKKKQKSSKLTALFEEVDSEEDEGMADYSDEDAIPISSRQSTPAQISEESGEEMADTEHTSLSSQTQRDGNDDNDHKAVVAKSAPLKLVSGNAAQRMALDDDDDDEDDGVIVKAGASRRTGRSMVVVDDSD